MNDGFYWLRSRSDSNLTIARCEGDRWSILGGLEGWWTTSEVREDHKILDRVQEPAHG